MSNSNLREKLAIIIFGHDTKWGQWFDIALIYAILISVLAVMLDTVDAINQEYGNWLLYAEWFFTLLFTIEYITRIYIADKPLRYVFSFYGLVDLVSVIPTYLALIFPGANYLLMIRILRVLRIFRVLKLTRYSQEANILIRSIYQSRRKILVFFFSVLVLSTTFGCFMYLVEGPDNGFTSIPKSIYWTIVTMTTVGYGDITPVTVPGQLIATLSMLMGYSIIAIPTGIITVQLQDEMRRKKAIRNCFRCFKHGHDADANFCKFCGTPLQLPPGQTEADI